MAGKKIFLFGVSFSGIIIFIFYYLHFKFTANIPIFDDYDAVIYFLSSFIESNTISDKMMWIITQHREHRYIFPRIFLLIYHFLFEEINFKVIIFIGHIALLGIYFLILKTIDLKDRVKNNLDRALIIASVTLLFFNLQYWEGSTWAIASFFFYFGMLFSFISMYLLSKNKNSLGLPLLFAILSSGTSGNGLLVFVVGAFLIYILKGFSKQLLYWIGAAAVVFVLYFWNYVSPTDQTPVSVVLLQKPFKLLIFYLSYLGSVFKQVPNYGNPVSILSGVLFFGLLIFLIIKKYYRSNPAVFGFIVFLFLTMASSSLARVDVGFISRYKIFSTLLVICFFISFIEIYSVKIKHIHLFVLFLLCVSFNVFSFIYNFDDMKKMKEVLVEGAILAKAGDYSLLVYPDSSSVKNLVQRGERNYIYSLPDFEIDDFISKEIDAKSIEPAGIIENTFNNFVDNEEVLYVNGWVNTSDVNSKIFLVLRSDKKVLSLNTTAMRRKELKDTNKEKPTDNSSYSIAILKKQMNVPSGTYDLGFYIDEGSGAYSYTVTDKKIIF